MRFRLRGVGCRLQVIENALVHTKKEDVFWEDGVCKHRAEETRVLTSEEVKSVIRKRNIQLTDYRKLWDEKKKIK